MKAENILKAVESVTKKWTRQRKAEERGRSQAARWDALMRPERTTIKDAVAAVMAEAYAKVSDNGRLPAQARQLYYAVRGPVLEDTGRHELNSQYFTQTVLPEYMASHDTSDWDVVFDARGHFAEPHTDKEVQLGTLDVREYLHKVSSHDAQSENLWDLDVADRAYPTCGPEHRFGAILFIEKEGFLPLFEKVKLAERFDIAVMSTKGMPVVACRRLADELCGPHGIPLLVLHDFDKSGFSIVGTLQGRGRWDRNYNDLIPRYEYQHVFDVIDLGLRLADVRAHGLQSEPVTYRSDPSGNLDANGATKEEIAFLCGTHDWRGYKGHRVELNAFTSPAFIAWIEGKLKQHGIKKIIPDPDTLAAAYRRAAQIKHVEGQLEELTEEATKKADTLKVPRSLASAIAKRLKQCPAMSWDEVVVELTPDLEEEE